MTDKEIKAAACLLQHALTLKLQHGKESDFCQPCSTCPQVKECKCDWLSMFQVFDLNENVQELVDVDIQALWTMQ